MVESSKPVTLVFDLFGTLFDVGSLRGILPSSGGDTNGEDEIVGDFIARWCSRQLEYFMCRALMSSSVSFEKITKDALVTTAKEARFERYGKILLEDIEGTMECWQKLKPYPEVALVLDMLSKHYSLIVLSNGDKGQIDNLLGKTKLTHFFDHVISTSILKTYKPDPLAYMGLLTQSHVGTLENCAFISSHYWDVVGAKHVGMKAYWIQRSTMRMSDTWEYKPDKIAPDLAKLSEMINPSSL